MVTSKLLILDGKIIPVVCDENNLCLSLGIFLKLGSSIEDYPIILSEFYLKHISSETIVQEGTTFYFSISTEKVKSIDRLHFELLHCRNNFLMYHT